MTKEKFAKPISKVNTVRYIVPFYVRMCIMEQLSQKVTQVLQYRVTKRSLGGLSCSKLLINKQTFCYNTIHARICNSF
jgi:hypothetical protein